MQSFELGLVCGENRSPYTARYILNFHNGFILSTKVCSLPCVLSHVFTNLEETEWKLKENRIEMLFPLPTCIRQTMSAIFQHSNYKCNTPKRHMMITVSLIRVLWTNLRIIGGPSILFFVKSSRWRKLDCFVSINTFCHGKHLFLLQCTTSTLTEHRRNLGLSFRETAVILNYY